MRFAAPWVLLALPLPLIAAWIWHRRRARWDPRLPLPRASSRLSLGGSPWVAIDRGLPWVRGLVLLLLVLGLARPQSGSSIQSVRSLGVDIVVAIDHSGSMRAEDFVPDNRLAVAKQVVRDFVANRPGDRLGLVSFASRAATRCPLTLDHGMLQQFLAALDIAPEDQQQTAIGLGLATAVNRLRESDAKSRVVVLLTDGRNNAGEIGPRVATAAAKALGVKVYAIGVGSDGQVPFPVARTSRGVDYRMVRFEIDEALLQEVADETGGEYFRATDAEALRGVFDTIDQLERTEIDSRVRVVYTEMFHLLLLPAAGLLFLERLLLATRLRRIP